MIDISHIYNPKAQGKAYQKIYSRFLIDQKTMSSKWCAYFSETEPKEYSFLNFYKYRSKQVDFTFSFQKESYKLQMDLDNLEKDGSEESKKTSSLLKKKFKASDSFL